MKIGIVGVGYVGLVAGTCFSDVGNDVICMDQDQARIEGLNHGKIPIYEPGLGEMITRNVHAGRLRFTTNLEELVADSLVIVLAVGTPARDDGSADLSAVLEVCSKIAALMDGYRILVMKSTVPVGTHKKVTQMLRDTTCHPFDYVSNPEFLKEGAAIEDFVRPDRVILGADNPAVVEILKQLYAPYMRQSERILVMDPASAEMTKYAANAMLATKITFINEIAGLCEHYGADVEKVRRGIGSDSRIGRSFLFPGVGYGGSCFPKDVTALIDMGKQNHCTMRIINAVHEANQYQREKFARRILDYYGPDCKKTTLAVWGLSFKARTDDVRESPAISGIRWFLDHGMKIRAHDPEAMPNAVAVLDGRIETFEDGYKAIEGADGLVIFTDWQEFRTPDFDRIKRKLARPVIFDGRNLYDPALLNRQGIEYYCIGRPHVPING